MDYWQNLLDKDIHRLSEWILNGYSPKHILLVGTSETRFVQQLRNAGIFTSDETISEFANRKGSVYGDLDGTPDLILFGEEAFAGHPSESVLVQMNSFGQPINLLIAFSVSGFLGAIPEVTKTLFNAGYVRDFSVAPWMNDQYLINAFHKHNGDISSTVGAYEGQLWRMTQLSEKRRSLLQGYRDEIFREISMSRVKDLEIRRWEERWEAFHNSRTGQTIKNMQRIRHIVIPSGSIRDRTFKFGFRTAAAIKREGPIRFVRAIPSRIKQRINWQKGLWHLRQLQASNHHGFVDIEPVLLRKECESHSLDVDIIICIHNALDDVKICLSSLKEHTTQPYRLILIDDGSGPETKNFLAAFAAQNDITLLRSEQATGYTRAANRGLRESKAGLVVLLNSDTILSPCWLGRMVCCAQADPSIGIVGPLSNTASWQSVPKIEDQGDWAQNLLPEGMDVAGMSALLTRNTVPVYPRMPFLNGFCLLIKRELIEAIGIFDEESFGEGYGEENDYALRTKKAGWELALADDAYVYHAQSKSYSTERRKMLADRAMKTLQNKHGEKLIQEGVEYCHYNRVLEGIRARAEVALERHEAIEKGKTYQGKRVLFILPIATPGGGTNVIRTESLSMLKMGVDIQFFNLDGNKESFSTAYPSLEIPTLYGKVEDIPNIAAEFDAVVATYNPTVRWMTDIQQVNRKPIRGYYVQDFEPLMYPTFSKDYDEALASYSLLSDLVLFTKTDWNRKIVLEKTGQRANLVGPSLEIDLYRPRPRKGPEWPYRPLRIAAMVRPESAYREPYKTMQLLQKVAKKYGGKVEIRIFGSRHDDLNFLALPHDFPWILHGVIPQEKVANLMSEVDIFVDCSSHQAMGLTAMEAMACGCAVIVPLKGGATSFARNEHNSIVVDTSSFDAVYEGLERFINDDGLRARIQRNAIYDTCRFFPERAALNILSVLFEGDR